MSSFLLMIIIGICFWIYTTKINPNFYNEMQSKLIDFVNDTVKKINPLGDNLFNDNIPLMKINLYLTIFNKNLDLYNKIYNSTDFAFLNIQDIERPILLNDISNLIPYGVQLSEDMIKTKLNTTIVTNKGFSKFFIDLSNVGAYLLDYWSIFYELLKPLLIIKSLNFTETQKISKLNNLHPEFTTYDKSKFDLITQNMDKIVNIIFSSIIRISRITVNYKQIIDLNNQYNNPGNNMSTIDYNTEKTRIITSLNEYINQLNTFLNNTDFEYSYIKSYIYSIISVNDFILNQENSYYIILYKVLNQVDILTIYHQNIDISILSKVNNIDL
jgi:hypothetical protein